MLLISLILLHLLKHQHLLLLESLLPLLHFLTFFLHPDLHRLHLYRICTWRVLLSLELLLDVCGSVTLILLNSFLSQLKQLREVLRAHFTISLRVHPQQTLLFHFPDIHVEIVPFEYRSRCTDRPI